MKPWVIVDVEADGPYPGDFSMVCFGAVLLSDLDKTFYGETYPISEQYQKYTLSISGITREQHLTFPQPSETMKKFAEWLQSLNSTEAPIFIADNPAFDFAFISYYFHRFYGHNPFGWSGRRIGDIWAGCVQDVRKPWKQLRETKHTHNPVDDAMGNAQALRKMIASYKIKPLYEGLYATNNSRKS